MAVVDEWLLRTLLEWWWWGGGGGRAYDEQCPDGVVEEHNGCDEEHHQAGELGELFAVRNELINVHSEKEGHTYHDLFEQTRMPKTRNQETKKGEWGIRKGAWEWRACVV